MQILGFTSFFPKAAIMMTSWHSLGSVLFLLTISTLNCIIAAPVHIAPDDGLVPNGNFQEGPKPSNLKNEIIKGKYSLPEWAKKGSIGYISGGTETHYYFEDYMYMYFDAPSNVHAVRIEKDASLYQYLRVKKGSYYSVTFVVTKTCPIDVLLRVSTYNYSGDYYMTTLYDGKYADTFAWAFKATSDILKLNFSNPYGDPLYPACGPLLEAVGIKELLPFPKTTIGNLVKNGNFEIGPHFIKNYTNGVYIHPQPSNGLSPVPGWISPSTMAIKYISTKNRFIPSGSSAVELIREGREDYGSIAQVIRTIPTKSYILTFAIGDSNNGCAGSLGIEAYVANKTTKFQYESKGTGGFMQAKLKFQAISDRTTITFWSTSEQVGYDGHSYLCGPVLDDVRVVPAS